MGGSFLSGTGGGGAGLQDVGQPAQSAHQTGEADGVVDLPASLLGVQHSGVAERRQMARDDREVYGAIAGDLADGARRTAAGEVGQDGNPVWIADSL